MIHVVPTVVFDFALTVNKLPIEVDLVRELLPQIHLAPVAVARVERRSCHRKLRPSAPCREGDPMVALRYE